MPRTRGCPSHPSASATPLQARPASRDPRAPTDPLATLEAQAWTASPALKDPPAHLAQPVAPAKPDPRDPLATQEHSATVAPVRPVPLAAPALPEALAQLAHPVRTAKMASLVALVPLATQVRPVVLANPALLVPQATTELQGTQMNYFPRFYSTISIITGYFSAPGSCTHCPPARLAPGY